MALPLNERRGLNRQQAAEYLGVKTTYFDKMIRPRLIEMRMGTSTVFDRHDLDAVFEAIQFESSVTKVMKNNKPQDIGFQPIDAGTKESRKPHIDLNFRDVLTQLRQKKPSP